MMGDGCADTRLYWAAHCVYCGHSRLAHKRRFETDSKDPDHDCYFIQSNNQYCICLGFVTLMDD